MTCPVHLDAPLPCLHCRAWHADVAAMPLTESKRAKPGPKNDNARVRRWSPRQVQFGARVVTPSERKVALRGKSGGPR